MAPPFGQFTVAAIENDTQAVLVGLRDALYRAYQLEQWLTGYAQSDFTGAPLSMASADVAQMFTAIADASALYQIFLTGQAPGTYPQVSGPYVYQASINKLIGPES